MKKLRLAIQRTGFVVGIVLDLLSSVVASAYASLRGRRNGGNGVSQTDEAAELNFEDIAEAMAAADFNRLEELAKIPGFPNCNDPFLHQPYLHLAAEMGAPAVVEWLLGLGADPNLTNDHGMPPAIAVLDRPDPEAIAILNLLAARGAALDASCHPEHPPLHEAAAHGSPALVQRMLELGADPNVPNADTPPKSPLMVAEDLGRSEIVAVLQNGLNKQP